MSNASRSPKPRNQGLRPPTPNRPTRRTAEDVRFALGEWSLGPVLVACTAKGVLSIMIGEDADQLAEELRLSFPKLRFVRDDRGLKSRLARVIRFLEAPARGLDLPLDVRGTAFQLRVWDVVRTIPAGRTTTYAEVARRIGAPRAARAVGSACATNNLAIAIPCHRVLHADGSPWARRLWGANRQRALLDREATAGTSAQRKANASSVSPRHGASNPQRPARAAARHRA